MNKCAEVEAYVASAPTEQQATLKKLREEIRKALPHLSEAFESGMPVYKLEEEWISGFASRKKGAMFYCMRTKVLDEFEAKLGAARTGKSCVDLAGTGQLALARTILARLAKSLA